MTKHEKQIIYKCLIASIEGGFFPEWEFQTLIGVDKNYVLNMIKDWRNDSLNDINQVRVISSIMGNLIAYPHGKQKDIPTFVSGSIDEIINILNKLRQKFK